MLSSVLSVTAIVALLVACLVGVASLVFGLPGTFLIAAATLIYAWGTDFSVIQWTTPAWLLAMAVGAEVAELGITAAAAGNANATPSRRVTLATLAGAVIGGVIGTPFLFGIGSLLGAMAGAFIGAALAVSSGGGTWRESLRGGFAALRGRLFGFVLKTAVAVAMLLIVVAALVR